MGIAEDFAKADVLPPLDKWPSVWRRLFFKPHKNNNERYRLFAFLYLNGLPGGSCVYWVMYHNTYDSTAWRDMRTLSFKLGNNDPKTVAAMNRNRVYDFALGKVN